MIQALPAEIPDIVVTASRSPEDVENSPASVTIISVERIERHGQPLIPTLLRKAPSVAVSTSGPAGSLTDVRIRGAEANHTLLFIDGIRANDPAAGNTPRFELLNGDLFSKVEVVRGPQSALWGSEAIGGVIAVGDDSRPPTALNVLTEAGSFRFRRAAVQAGASSATFNLSGAAGWQNARGIDSFDGNGDREGYRHLSGRVRAAWAPSPGFAVGANGFLLTGRNDYDGYSPVTFARADTLDETHNRLGAGRMWSRIGREAGAWTALLSAALLRSSNRNLLASDEINQTWGKRSSFSGQLEHRFATNGVKHVLIAAVEHEKEDFRARDVIYGGFSNQDRDRNHQAFTGEWRADAGRIVADVAIRTDNFSRFKDATSLRGSLLGSIGHGVSLTAAYAQGIAQPTFFDLYGFFPGSFVGNPELKPESSRGFEVGARYRWSNVRASLTLYRQRLVDEIIDTPDFTSTTNASGTSRRAGVETELGWDAAPWLNLSAHYAYLKASEGHGGNNPNSELRRPRHSGSIAADGHCGGLTYGASMAYTGDHSDRRDAFPYDRVRLAAYWSADARVSYAVGRRFEVFARVANALDQRQQDVFGYRTEGRSVHAGLRVAARR